jgi:steroid delta-isomerase-like uncharacterized protein
VQRGARLAPDEQVIREIEEHLAAESAQDLPALLAGMTEDCYNLVICDPVRLYAGPDAVARRYKALWAAFPDLTVRLRRVLQVSAELAVTEHTLSGSHRGSLFGIPGTGRHVEVETVVVWEVVDGAIKGETVYFDLATMLRQVGYLTLPFEAGAGPGGCAGADQPGPGASGSGQGEAASGAD